MNVRKTAFILDKTPKTHYRSATLLVHLQQNIVTGDTNMMSVTTTHVFGVLSIGLIGYSFYEYRRHPELVKKIRSEVSWPRLAISFGVALGAFTLSEAIYFFFPVTDKSTVDLIFSPSAHSLSPIEIEELNRRAESYLSLLLLMSCAVVVVAPFILYHQEYALRYKRNDKGESSYAAVLNTIFVLLLGLSLRWTMVYYGIFVLLGRIYAFVYHTNRNPPSTENARALTDETCHEKALHTSTAYSILIFFCICALHVLSVFVKVYRLAA